MFVSIFTISSPTNILKQETHMKNRRTPRLPVQRAISPRRPRRSGRIGRVMSYCSRLTLCAGTPTVFFRHNRVGEKGKEQAQDVVRRAEKIIRWFQRVLAETVRLQWPPASLLGRGEDSILVNAAYCPGRKQARPQGTTGPAGSVSCRALELDTTGVTHGTHV